MAIVTVDFDGTLYQSNSLMPMLKTSKKELTLKQWYFIIANFLKISLSKENAEEKDYRFIFLKAFFSQMKGKNAKELQSFFMSAIENGQQGINKDMVMRINQHLEKGDSVIIISGTLKPFLKTFVQYLDIEADVIGTELLLDDSGICTGEIGKLNHGYEKINNLKLWIEENNGSGEMLWTYADSESDLPLMKFVDKAVVVNPSASMKKIAQSQGWQIF